MALLREKIIHDIQKSMKASKRAKLLVLRSLLTEIVTKEKKISSETILDDEQVITILIQEKKKYEESAMFAEQAGRDDLRQEALTNITIVEEYLPRQLSDDEVGTMIRLIIRQENASPLKDFGKVMKILSSQQVREADAYTIKNEPITSINLMERAAGPSPIIISN